MREQLQDIYGAVLAGRPAALKLEADGEVFTRVFRPQERLLLLGCGHISQALCRYAADLGFAVTVSDDRPDFANHQRFPDAARILCDDFSAAIRCFGVTESDYVAVLTRGHRYDADCLRELLKGVLPRYLGMIGSRRRVISLLELLAGEGYSPSALHQIHAPIGLDIHALTVKEIAISILAELISVRRADVVRHTAQRRLTEENIDLPLLESLACDPTPKALLLVYETCGSTPVKSGAMMAIDKNHRSVGTIGGGCSENAVLHTAYRLIGSGAQRCVTVDMSGDVAEEEGMVCGGWMKVFLLDIT